MSSRQKVILIIFLVIDLIVVTTLVSTIIKYWVLYQASTTQSRMPECAGDYLETLQDHNRQITFAMTEDVIYITVSTQIIANQHLIDDEQVIDEAQMLWTFLDSLRTVTDKTTGICLTPQILILEMNTARENGVSSYQASIPMPDLIAWSQDKLNDTDFAASIQYRQMRVPSDEINKLEP